MPNAVEYSKRKAERFCVVCGTLPNTHGYLCDPCAARNRRSHKRQMDRIQLRTGSRRILAEWQVQEIEDQLKWNKENIHLEARSEQR